MRASRTLGISVVAAALSGTMFLGAQALFADGHHGSVVRMAGSSATSTVSSATVSPANDPWD